MRIAETCKVGLEGFSYLPNGLANSTDVVDKFCKLLVAIFEANVEFRQSIKDATGVFSTFGLITTITPMLDTSGDFWKKSPIEKIASKVTLAAAQVLDLLKGLDTYKLVPLESISDNLGRFKFFSDILNISPPLAIAKDALIVLSTAFSIKVNYDEYVRLSNVVHIIAPTPAHNSKVHTARINLIADLFKLAVVGLTLGLVLYGVGMSTVLYATSYGAIKVGMVVNGLGLISASTALIKALRGYSIANP